MIYIYYRPVLPSVTPGYLRPLIPENAPDKPENWTDVMADIERVIMPGVTHWHSPRVRHYSSILYLLSLTFFLFKSSSTPTFQLQILIQLLWPIC